MEVQGILFISNYFKKQAITQLRSMSADFNIKNYFFKRLFDSIYFFNFILHECGENLENIKQKIVQKLKSEKICFIRNILFVDKIFYNLNDNLSILQDYIVSKINTSFFIQCLTYNTKLKAREIEVRLGKAIETITDYQADFVNPKQIVAIILYKNTCYLSITNIENLLYMYLDPFRFWYRKSKSEIICRSQFKLLEVISRLKINLNLFKNALDIGASPGGWSKVLLDHHLNVTSIDPAELDPRIVGKVNHIKKKIEEVLGILPKKFDLLVNDMNLPPLHTVDLLNKVSKLLVNNALVITTFKIFLPYKIDETLKNIVSRMSKNFKLRNILNLYSNKKELIGVFEKNE